jgi:hypothetical protein
MKRILKTWQDAKLCDTCKAAQVTTLTTHSTTDFRETASGEFQETQPRYGCKDHHVAPMVYLLSGESILVEEFNARFPEPTSVVRA